jgi:hypothetical protein
MRFEKVVPKWETSIVLAPDMLLKVCYLVSTPFCGGGILLCTKLIVVCADTSVSGV